MDMEIDRHGRELQDLPEEVLEYIFSLTSPYQDLQNLMIVCKRFYAIARAVIVREKTNFEKAVVEGPLEWTSQHVEYGATISERYSHCAVLHNRSLYVFGGCTSSSTTFNDLWRFDLASREWIRPLTLGTYPSPKACATMVLYKDYLVLFGGWSHPTPYPLHQAARFFDQLHMYHITTNQWSLVYPRMNGHPEGIAGHSASVIGEQMIVFGGSHGHGQSCNKLWVLNLEEMVWHSPEVSVNKPLPRYGHSQIVLDDTRLMVIGGCGGPNMQLTDMWLLTIGEGIWTWQELKILNIENSPPQLWCHAATKVGDNVVVLSKMSKQQQLARQKEQADSAQSSQQTQPAAIQQPTRAWLASRLQPQGSQSSRLEPLGCHNPRLEPQGAESARPSSMATLVRPEISQGQASTSQGQTSGSQGQVSPSESKAPVTHAGPSFERQSSAASVGRTGMPSIRPNAMKNRQKQLETLKRYEDKLRLLSQPGGQRATSQPLLAKACRVTNPMHLHVLDISEVISKHTVQWQPINTEIRNAPPNETIFYSLHHGRAELIMFGGIQADLNSMQREVNLQSAKVSNSVHFIKSKKLLH